MTYDDDKEKDQEIRTWLRSARPKLAVVRALGVALLEGKAEERFVSLLTALDAALAAVDALSVGLSSDGTETEDDETPPRP